jgi:dipeptidyl aminopeptidase/acylaminoacyl peptidase
VWSPDGKQIAFDSGAAGAMDVYVVDANGGAPRRLTSDRVRGMMPSWSRNGKWIYFSSAASGRNEIWKIPSAGGTAAAITHDGGIHAVESSDGTALYYGKSDAGGDLFRSRIDGSGDQLVLRGAAKRNFVVTEDRIYYLREDTNNSATLRVCLLRSGETIEITRVWQPLFGG